MTAHAVASLSARFGTEVPPVLWTPPDPRRTVAPGPAARDEPELDADEASALDVLAAPQVRIEARATPYARYFAVEELLLRHRLHLGGWSDPLLRAVFVSGDAVVVLPWDPVRDRVLLVDQLRAGPVARVLRLGRLLRRCPPRG